MRKIKVRVYRRNPKRRKAKSSHRRRRVTSRRRNPVRARKRSVRRHRKVTARRRNPARSRKRSVSRRRVNRRRNPSMALGKIMSLDTLKRAASIGGGFIAGRQLISLLTMGTVFGKSVFTPPSLLTTTLRPFMGLIGIIAGSLLAKKAKGKVAGDIALGLIAAGGVDIITTVANKVSPGLLGTWINDPLSAFRSPMELGTEVTATRGLNGIGRQYTIPRDLQLGSSFAAGGSSFE